MPEPLDVKIPFDPILRQTLGDHCVGLVSFGSTKSAESGTLAGTGVFVRIGDIYGVITAAHVLKVLDGAVGMVRFPRSDLQFQNTRIDLAHTQQLTLWSGKDCDAPDIAFLRITELHAKNLAALGAVFHNLSIPREILPTRSDSRMARSYALVGVVGEWTETERVLSPNGIQTRIGGIIAPIKTRIDFVEGTTELIEITLDYSSDARVPLSYGGVSGGALWELYIELDGASKVVMSHRRLNGIAFRQSADRTSVTLNGTKVIFDLVHCVIDKWV